MKEATTTTTTTTTNASNQGELRQKDRKTMMRHKVSKHHVRTFQIAVKRPAETCSRRSTAHHHHHHTTTTTTTTHAQPDIHAIARQLKQRLSKALSKLAGAHEDDDDDGSSDDSTSKRNDNNNNPTAVTDGASSDDATSAVMETKPLLLSRLNNLTLLKQYLTFVAQETGTRVDIKQTGDNGCGGNGNNHKIEITVPEKRLKEENKIRTCLRRDKDGETATISNMKRCDAARLGARLIESHVHSYNTRMRSVIDKDTVSTTTSFAKQKEGSDKNKISQVPSTTEQGEKDVPEKKKTTAPSVVQTREEEQKPANAPRLATRRSALSDRRRRPGRPPTTKRLMEQQQQQPALLRRSSRHVMSYTSVVKCICDTPDEEFGPMVQCDDCQRWLHLDCLKMSEAALGKTFRCPLCFVALGGCKETNKLVSSMTWRFAARRQSEQMAAAAAAAAAAAKKGPTTDDDDDVLSCSSDGDDDSESNDYNLNNAPPPPPLLQQRGRRRHRRRFEKPQPSQQQVGRVMLSIVTPPSSSSSSTAIEALTAAEVAEQHHSTAAMDLDDHCSTTSSSDDNSPSEASTPEQTFYPTDPFDAMDTDNQQQQQQQEPQEMALDFDSIEFLSRLVYLQSLDSMQKEVFAPNASDVFLYEDSNNKRDTATATTSGGAVGDPATVIMMKKTVGGGLNTPGVIPRYPSDTLPSSMCPQLLKEFSFDSGPFWKTMR